MRTIEITPEIEKLINRVKEEETFLLSLRERLEMRRICAANNDSHKYHVARMTAFIDALDAVGVDRSEFNWIFNL